MEEIASKENDYNLNISRYISTAEPEPEIDLAAVHKQLMEIDERIASATAKHNSFVKRSLNGPTKRSLIGPTSPAPRGAGEVGM